MASNVDQQSRIKHYLLGISDPPEKERLEQRLLTDKDFLLEFSIVKDELVHDYLDGALSQDDAARFEKHFLSTQRGALKVEISKMLTERARAEALMEHAKAAALIHRSQRRRRLVKWLVFAGVAVAILVGVPVWLVFRSKPSSVKPPQWQQLTAALEKLNDPRTVLPPNAVASASLKQIYVRGSKENRRVIVSDSDKIILLRLELGGERYESYRASLQTAEGAELGVLRTLKPNPDAGAYLLELRLPAEQVPSGSYEVSLEGLNTSGTYESVGLYPFQVVKS